MQKNQYILAIDQGTTGSTALLVSLDPYRQSGYGTRVIARGYDELPQHFPKPGWVEHDLNDIWKSSLIAIHQALSNAHVTSDSIVAIGITNQRETTGVWDLHGEPLAKAIVWQDRRTAQRCDTLKKENIEKHVQQKTGLLLDPYFSATKIEFMIQNIPGLDTKAKNKNLRFGTIDTWLIDKLTQGQSYVTDASNASRTMLYNIHTNAWDHDLLSYFHVPNQDILPQVVDSSGIVGFTKSVPGLRDGIPIAGIAGDQQAALFGQACFQTGMAKCTYGTGAFALVNTGEQCVQSQHALLSTIAWRIKQQTTYALEGSTFVAGAIVQWLRDGLGIIRSSSEIEALAESVQTSEGVVLVPALTGLGAPHWNPHARGLITGITRGTTKAHIARAALEGIAMQIVDLFEAMRSDSQQQLQVLRVDGGASQNNLMMQFQADMLQVAIHRPEMIETTALGAAYLAALGVEMFADLTDVEKSWHLDKIYFPSMSQEKIEAYKNAWNKALTLTK